MKFLPLRHLCLAAILAALALAGCAGTRDNAQQTDAAAQKGATMTTPF